MPIVNDAGEIITRALSNDILHGITRQAVLDVARLHQLKVIERAFSIEELKSAKEAFSTSASGFVNPVVRADDTVIGDGKPGAVSKALRESYIASRFKTAI